MTRRNPALPIDRDMVAYIKGMAQRGDRQMDIATWFGINQARVNEILKGSTTWARQFRDVEPAEESALPDPGPYEVVSRVQYLKMKSSEGILEHILKELESIKEGLSLNANTRT